MNTTLRALTNQAERLVRTEIYEEAIALCQAVLRRYPRYARCYRILGEAYLGLAEHEEAAKLFRRSLGVDPEDPVAYAGLAIIFEERGLLEEAIWQLERAFELAPGSDELRRELARLFQRRASGSRVQLTRAALARLYARGGLWNKAIGELHDLLAREPYRLDLRVTLARTLWRARRRPEAAQVAQAIVDQAPNCLVARLILGTYWCQEGREDEGRGLLQGAQELDPENREAARLLGRESPLPLRVAHLDSEFSVPPDGQDEDEEPDTVGLWPRGAEEQSGPGAAPPASTPEEEEAPPSHIVTLPAEEVQALLGSLAASDEDVSPEPSLAPPVPAEPVDEPAGALGDGDGRDGAEAGRALAAPELSASPAADDGVPPAISTVAMLRHRLDAAPENREARLALARALVESGRLPEALPLYDSLASPTSGCLDKILADLEAIAAGNPRHRGLRELMGDAYARAGRFQEAMGMYRWLLANDDPTAEED